MTTHATMDMQKETARVKRSTRDASSGRPSEMPRVANVATASPPGVERIPWTREATAMMRAKAPKPSSPRSLAEIDTCAIPPRVWTAIMPTMPKV